MSKPHVFLYFSLILVGCSGSSSNDSELSLDGLWRSDGQVYQAYIAEYFWSFENNEFVNTIEFSDGSSPEVQSGTYSIGNPITMSSGLTAYEINLTYVNSDDTKTHKLDSAYINNNSLYFGLPNPLDSCEGEYYEENSFQLVIEDDIAVGVEEVTICFGRPDTLELSLPYHLKL